jgi:branched-chain amino acid transport system permease protein
LRWQSRRSDRAWRRDGKDMLDLLEQFVHGLTLGSMYAMVAAGLALMLGVARLINFAHGEFFMLGAYAFWYGYQELDLPYVAAGLLAPLLMLGFGVAYQRTVIRAILSRSWHVQLIATLATSIVVTNLAIIVFGTQPKEVPTPLSSRIVTLGDMRLTWQRLLVLGASVVIFWALHRFVKRTRAGKAMRAMSQNREACAVVGVNVQKVAMMTFALSAALAALAATLVSPLFNIFPDMGAGLTLKAFAAVVAGGFGYVNGAIAASFLIGVTEALAGSYVSYAYKDAIAFLVMIAVLLWRPQGLFGRRLGV